MILLTGFLIWCNVIRLLINLTPLLRKCQRSYSYLQHFLQISYFLAESLSIFLKKSNHLEIYVLLTLLSYYFDLHYVSNPAEWTPALWTDTFNELLNDDNELDYEDQWSLNFSYSHSDTLTKEEKKRGWKIYCHCAYGR